MIERNQWREEGEEEEELEQIEEVKEEKRQSFTIVDGVARSVCIVCTQLLEVPFTNDMSAQMEQKMNIHLMAAHALNLSPELRNKTCDERAGYFTQCTSNDIFDIDIKTGRFLRKNCKFFSV